MEGPLGAQSPSWDGHVFTSYTMYIAGTQQPECKAGRWRVGLTQG